MNNKSMGQFIAALRKSKGMTQQNVADQLNVSNKAVSRWERDECAPDISLIPALAEMLGVTCDELLRGERILNEPVEEKKNVRVEKQLKAIVNKTISSFKTMIYIAMAFAIAGLISMLGISYGFYRPVIGFFVMLIFEMIAIVLTLIAINKTKAVKTDNELFEEISYDLRMKYDNTLGKYSFLALYLIFSAIAAVMPLIIIRDRYLVESVLEFESYMGYLLFIVIVLVCGYFLLSESVSALLAGIKKEEKEVGKINKINLLQIGLLVGATVLFVLTPYADTHNSSLAANCIVIVALLLLVINIVVGIVAFCKAKKGCRLEIIRNMLLSIPVFLVSHWQYAIYTYTGEEEILQNSELNTMYEKSVTLMPEWIAATVVFALIIVVIFNQIKKRI